MTEQNIADINWLVRLRRDLGFCLSVVIEMLSYVCVLKIVMQSFIVYLKSRSPWL